MYARSTTTRGNPQQIDDAIAYLRDEVMPTVTAMPGCIGLSMMCDRESGRCIATTSWDSEEAMHNSEPALFDMRMRYAQIMGSRPEVQEWEVAIMHRMRPAPENAACRVIWGRGDPAMTERMLDTFRMSLMPRMEDLPGFCSVSMLVDRETGRSASAVVYESRDAMMQAAPMGKAMREEFMNQIGSEITEVAEFDLVVAHLRVPETV